MPEWGERSQIDISVGTIDARAVGPVDGAPVLLLHGFPQTSLSWAYVAPRLAESGMRILAVDQRGYSVGARPAGAEHYTTSLLAGDVIEIADALGWRQFHLVGHDWGSAVAWTVAANYPDRLSALTAVSVPHLAAYGRALARSPDQQRKSTYLKLFAQSQKASDVLLADDARRLIALYQGKVSDEDIARYVEHFSQPGALVAALNYYQASGRELSELSSVTVSTTFVWSSGDDFVGRDAAELCIDYVEADYRYVELPGVSHWIADQAPGELAQAIIDRVVS